MSVISSEWRELLLKIPGYDPIATCGDSWFSDKAAQRAIDFFPKCIRHVEGDIAGRPFVLERWQQAINANIFGWKRRDDKGRVVRRYREVFIYEPRGNGKTAWAAGICLYVLCCDNEPGAQVYGAAAEREQAALLFRHAKGMVEQEKSLDELCKVYGGAGHRSIVMRRDAASSYKVLSADAFSKHGFNTHFAVVDELHAHPNRDLVDVLKTSMGKANRKQPLMIYITTADYDRPSICNEKYSYACKVRDGIVDDPTFLPVVYEAGRDDDWRSESVWAKANPNLGVSVKIEHLRSECKQAMEVPAYENTFRRLHLNQRTTTAEKFIPLEQWDACAHDIDVASLAGRDCFVGMDIGSTSDFTALACLFPHSDVEIVTVKTDPSEGGPGIVLPTERKIARRSYTLLMEFWLPASPVRRDANMQAQIEAWRKLKLIRTTPGNQVDYDLVLPDIMDILKTYRVRDVSFDYGFQGLSVATNLMKAYGDHRVHMVQQGIMSMAAPFREMLELLPAKRIHHDGNKVMRWMVSNVVGEFSNGLVKPSKKKSTEKIDGVTALVMALKGALSAASAYQAPYGANGLRD